jgi:diacylglycerol kinase (ATP)
VIDSVLIVVNPISGHGRGPRLAEVLRLRLERQGLRVAVEQTRCAGDGTRIAAEAAGWGAVLAVGGDGTINEIVCGLAGRGIPLGIVPLGTANVIAKELGHRRDPDSVCALLSGARVRPIDLIEVLEDDGRHRRFAIAMAGAGIDAQIVKTFHAWRRGPIIGHVLYLVLGFAMVLDYRVPSLRVEVDGAVVDEDASFLIVANMREYAGVLSFAPAAVPDDGYLDVYRYRALGRFDYLRAFYAALWRHPEWSGRSSCSRGREVRVTVRYGQVPLQVDGDPAGEAPARFRLRPFALPLLVPSRPAGFWR